MITQPQGKEHFRTAQLNRFLELLARKRLGTHWAKYQISRCRLWTGMAGQIPEFLGTQAKGAFVHDFLGVFWRLCYWKM